MRVRACKCHHPVNVAPPQSDHRGAVCAIHRNQQSSGSRLEWSGWEEEEVFVASVCSGTDCTFAISILSGFILPALFVEEENCGFVFAGLESQIFAKRSFSARERED